MASQVLNSKQFYPTIKEGNLDNSYLFLGEEEAEKNKAIEIIAGIFFTKGEARNIMRFHVDSGDFMAGADFFLSESMFSPKKIAIFSGIDSLSKKNDESLLSQILDSASENSLAIFTSSQNRAPSFFSKKAETKQVIFWRMFESELQSYIISTFKEMGLTIDRDSSSIMLSLLGRDLGKVDAAINRIVDSGEKSITRNLILSLIADEREIRVFDLIASLFKKKKDSLYLLKKLLDDRTPELFTLSMITKRAEEIELFHHLRETGETVEGAFDKALSNQKDRADFQEQCKLFTHQAIKNITIKIHKAELELKSGGSGSDLLSNPLTDLAYEIIT